MRTQSTQIPDVLAAFCPWEHVIYIKKRVCGEVTGWVDDTQRALITTSADPLLTRRDLHALRRCHLDARWETLFAKERVALLEFDLKLGDHSVQLTDCVT